LKEKKAKKPTTKTSKIVTSVAPKPASRASSKRKAAQIIKDTAPLVLNLRLSKKNKKIKD
jgi:hypothetical protein